MSCLPYAEVFRARHDLEIGDAAAFDHGTQGFLLGTGTTVNVVEDVHFAAGDFGARTRVI